MNNTIRQLHQERREIENDIVEYARHMSDAAHVELRDLLLELEDAHRKIFAAEMEDK